MDQSLIANIQQQLGKVFGLAGQDPAFHALCLQNPTLAFTSVTGLELPAGHTIRFVETDKKDCIIVLPPLESAVPSGELADAELDKVVGGVDAGKVATDVAWRGFILPEEAGIGVGWLVTGAGHTSTSREIGHAMTSLWDAL